MKGLGTRGFGMRRRYTAEIVRMNQVAQAVCAKLNAGPGHVLSTRRVRGVNHDARIITYYLVVTLFDVSRRRLARVCGLHPETVASFCRRVEIWRDDPKREQLIAAIELQLRGAA